MKTEKELSKKLAEKLGPMYDVHDLQLAGVLSMPDLYINSLSTGGFFLELKRVEKESKPIKFQKGQTTWLVSHQKRGGRAAVAVLDIEKQQVWIFQALEAKRLDGTSLQEAKRLCEGCWDLTQHWANPDVLFCRTIFRT